MATSDGAAVKTLKRRLEYITSTTKDNDSSAVNYINAERIALRLAVVRITQVRVLMDEMRSLLGENSPELKSLVERLNNYEIAEFGKLCGNNPIWSERKQKEN